MNEIFIFYSDVSFTLPTCKFGPLKARCPWKQDDIGSHETGVPDGRDPKYGCWEQELGPPRQPPMVTTAEPVLHTQFMLTCVVDVPAYH